MQYSSPSEYLKQLKIQKFYVNKFKVNYANANNLTPFIKSYLNALDKEIKEYEDFISAYKLKKNLEKYKNQVSIYDFLGE